MMSVGEITGPNGHQAKDRFLEYEWESCLDIGCGPEPFIPKAVTLDFVHPADIQADYLKAEFQPFDALWCSHVLEHQRNPGLFLEKMRRDVKPGGVVAITVPPYRDYMAGGHIHLGNEFHLLYNMVLAGFDCSEARVGVYGYNISVIVRRKDAVLPPLIMDRGDLDALAVFFPCKLRQKSDGRVGNIRW